MEIRAEQAEDYAGVATVHALAFERAAESTIVALLRQRGPYDPQLSLVALDHGRVIGHVMFSPHRIRLMGQDVHAVNLAPIAVHPAHQGTGVGAALIHEGHRIAAAKGYALSFLLGHPEYYSRFGYKPHAYGSSVLKLSPESIGRVSNNMEVRVPQLDDLPALRELWRYDEANVDFSLDPGPDLLDWLSPNPGIEARVYLREGRVVGFVRLGKSGVRAFYTNADSAARSIAQHLLEYNGAPISLPVHPSSHSALAFVEHATCEAWEAGMALSLAPSPFTDYMVETRKGSRPAGRVLWPPAFELA